MSSIYIQKVRAEDSAELIDLWNDRYESWYYVRSLDFEESHLYIYVPAGIAFRVGVKFRA
jgi:hypothetical protein